jgi:hypothetical protein
VVLGTISDTSEGTANFKTAKELLDSMKKPVKVSHLAESLLVGNVVHSRKADFSMPKLIDYSCVFVDICQ